MFHIESVSLHCFGAWNMVHFFICFFACINFYVYGEAQVAVFSHFNVTDVIRLNVPLYDKNTFVRAGMLHHDLQFEDGGTPSLRIIDQFLQIATNSVGMYKTLASV